MTTKVKTYYTGSEGTGLESKISGEFATFDNVNRLLRTSGYSVSGTEVVTLVTGRRVTRKQWSNTPVLDNEPVIVYSNGKEIKLLYECEVPEFNGFTSGKEYRVYRTEK